MTVGSCSEENAKVVVNAHYYTEIILSGQLCCHNWRTEGLLGHQATNPPKQSPGTFASSGL